jgi:hypothetical protein
MASSVRSRGGIRGLVFPSQAVAKRRTVKRLWDRFRSPQAIFAASRTELEGAGVSGAVAQSIVSGCVLEDAATPAGKGEGIGRGAGNDWRPALS